MPSLTDSFIGHSRDHLHTLLITYLRRYGSTYMPVDRTTWCRDTIMTGQSLTSLRSKKTNITDFSLLITVEDLLSRAKCFLVLPIVVRKMTHAQLNISPQSSKMYPVHAIHYRVQEELAPFICQASYKLAERYQCEMALLAV